MAYLQSEVNCVDLFKWHKIVYGDCRKPHPCVGRGYLRVPEC